MKIINTLLLSTIIMFSSLVNVSAESTLDKIMNMKVSI